MALWGSNCQVVDSDWLGAASTVSQPEIHICFSMGARIGALGGSGKAGVEGADEPRQAREIQEKVLHGGGDGGVVLRGPDAGLAVGIVADGYGDVAHGCPLDWVGFWLVFSIVRRGRVIKCN